MEEVQRQGPLGPSLAGAKRRVIAEGVPGRSLLRHAAEELQASFPLPALLAGAYACGPGDHVRRYGIFWHAVLGCSVAPGQKTHSFFGLNGTAIKIPETEQKTTHAHTHTHTHKAQKDHYVIEQPGGQKTQDRLPFGTLPTTSQGGVEADHVRR